MSTQDTEFTRDDGIRVRIRRSARRTRTVSAAWRDGVAVVSVPVRMTRAAELEWAEKMIAKLLQRQKNAPAGEPELMERAARLSRKYLQGRAQPLTVRWVSNQRRRWGSATASEGSIRLSSRMLGMPEWVLDYVLVHELAHLVADDGHGPVFRSLEESYPRHLEAKAFLDGVSWATDQGPSGHRPGQGEADDGMDDLDEDRRGLNA